MLPVVVCALDAGCAGSSLADKRVRARLAKLSAAPQVWAESEARRPTRVRNTAARIPAGIERHRERLIRDARFLDDWQARDFERWQSSGPLYLQHIRRIMRGKPERIERAAVTIGI